LRRKISTQKLTKKVRKKVDFAKEFFSHSLSLSPSLTLSLVRISLCHSRISLCHSLPHSFTPSLSGSLPISLPLSHSLTLFLCHSLTRSLSNSVTLSHHSVTLSHLTLSVSYSLILSHLILSPSHSVTCISRCHISLCHSLTLSPCYSLSLSLSSVWHFMKGKRIRFSNSQCLKSFSRARGEIAGQWESERGWQSEMRNSERATERESESVFKQDPVKKKLRALRTPKTWSIANSKNLEHCEHQNRVFFCNFFFFFFADQCETNENCNEKHKKKTSASRTSFTKRKDVRLWWMEEFSMCWLSFGGSNKTYVVWLKRNYDDGMTLTGGGGGGGGGRRGGSRKISCVIWCNLAMVSLMKILNWGFG